MLRGWTFAVVGVSTLLASAASAQPAAGVSLAERLGFFSSSKGSEDAETRTIRDSNVRPAAVAAENSPRSPRDAAIAPPTKRRSSGGGLFSKFHLPNLMPGSKQQLSDPPVAYDPNDAGGESPMPTQGQVRGSGQSQGQRQTQARTQGQTQAQGQTQGSTNPAARTAARRPGTTAAAPRRTTAAAPGATAAAPTNTNIAPPRVTRSSPRNDNRHNELADALTGLRDDPATEEAGEATEQDLAADESGSDVAPPAADDGVDAPSYLNESADDADAVGSVPQSRSAAAGSSARATSRGPVDVHDALAGGAAAAGRSASTRTPRTGATTSSAPRTGATTTSPAPAATSTRRTTATPAPAATRRSATQSAPVRRSPTQAPTVETDIAAELRGDSASSSNAPVDNPGEALGGIVAESTPPAFESEPTPPTPVVANPSRTLQSTKPSAIVGVPSPVGGLRSKRDVLVSVAAPLVVSSVSGPQRIVVGRPAEYKVVLENKGEGPARDMVATVAVPTWADVADASASNGAVDQPAPASEGAPHRIQWRLYELAAGASQTLTMQLIPRSGRPLQLAVTCEQAPSSAETTVEVQEPKLQMDINGPAEVTFGKSQRYTLTLSNPGTGNAEEVSIELIPPGGDPKAPVRHKVGALAAGASKSIELELTAREAGDLKMQAVATAAGELRSEAVKTVLCRKAELDIDWRGPDKNFSGAVATYYIRLRNPGTAAADKVAVELSLPAGAELIDASAGHSWDASRRVVAWRPGSVGSSEERFMQIRCKLSKPGVNQMELVARTEAGDLSDVQSMPVTVEALADLKLQVSDPQGIVPVGDAGTYEIRVQNRGQTAARGVNVVAMFSEGLDPTHVEGGQHDIRDGRVAFRTIDSLPAGAEVVLRIHAKATQPGTHTFRTEVVCDDVETKLVAEETTRFFVEEERWADASSAYSEQAGGATR